MRPRRLRQVVSIVVGFVLLGGCASDKPLSRFVRPDDDALARAYFDSVRTGRIDYALSALAPEAASIPGVRDSLANLSAHLPAGPLDSLHIVGVNRFESSTIDRSNLTYEYHSAQGWGAVAIAITGGPTGRFIEGIRANRLTQSLEQGNAFTFRGKGAGHYLMLVLVLVCVGSALWVAALALRTNMKRRWAWAILALVGAGTVMFDWTTGQVGFRLLNLLFLDAAITRGGAAAPWILQAAFPVGAVMTWRRIQQARNPTPSPDGSIPTATATATPPAISTDSTPVRPSGT